MHKSKIAKEISVRDIDRNYNKVNGKKSVCIISQINKTFKCKYGVSHTCITNMVCLEFAQNMQYFIRTKIIKVAVRPLIILQQCFFP